MKTASASAAAVLQLFGRLARRSHMHLQEEVLLQSHHAHSAARQRSIANAVYCAVVMPHQSVALTNYLPVLHAFQSLRRGMRLPHVVLRSLQDKQVALWTLR